VVRTVAENWSFCGVDTFLARNYRKACPLLTHRSAPVPLSIRLTVEFEGVDTVLSSVTTGVPWGFQTPRNSEVLKKLGQIPSFVEYTSVTT
jgi:hypothetical protein